MSLEGVHIRMENLDEAIEVVHREVEKLERAAIDRLANKINDLGKLIEETAE
jgi:prefoldin subunit 5